MHNGQIGDYERIRREIENLIPRDAYRHRHGTTDSEAFFLLAIGNGLLEDPPGALARTVAQVRGVMDAERVSEPFRMTAAFADGSSLCALRVSTDDKPPSLFFAEGGEVEVEAGEVRMRPGRGSILVMSEPLDAHDEAWREVPPGHVLESRGGVARVSALAAA
jgi:glutamine amidotransferase